MLPVIALVGRPNVGKSTLFNRLTKTRDAIVADFPGLTRDRQYGEGRLGDRPYIVIDTGGIGEEEALVDNLMSEQSRLAIMEADHVFFLVDGRVGITGGDEAIANQLRQLGKAITIVVNKTDGVDQDIALADFYTLGFGEPFAIAASQGRGVKALIDSHLETLVETEITAPEERGIQIAIVGRPNVGKSTLVNRMLGEERVVVCDLPGTTRDSIFVPLERHGQRYTLVDTAGVRRRSKVDETVEKFSVIKTLQSIEQSHVAIMLFDGSEDITDQDLHLLSFIIDSGKALVMAVNKWDGLSTEQREQVKVSLGRRLQFADFAKLHFISAKHGTGVGDLYKSIQEAYKSATKELSTGKLNTILQHAITQHQPPLVRGRRIKLRYAHSGGHNPPIIVIHGNQTESLPHAYQRYLINTFREALKLVGTPIRLQMKSGENPYAGKRNKLTLSQQRKRKRLFAFQKKK